MLELNSLPWCFDCIAISCIDNAIRISYLNVNSRNSTHALKLIGDWCKRRQQDLDVYNCKSVNNFSQIPPKIALRTKVLVCVAGQALSTM